MVVVAELGVACSSGTVWCLWRPRAVQFRRLRLELDLGVVLAVTGKRGEQGGVVN